MHSVHGFTDVALCRRRQVRTISARRRYVTWFLARRVVRGGGADVRGALLSND
jgi:hypothetical protein